MRYLWRLMAIVLAASMALGASQCQHGNNTVASSPGSPSQSPTGSPPGNTSLPNFQASLAIEDSDGSSANDFSEGQQIQFVVDVDNYNPVPLIVLVHSCVPPIEVVVENTSTSQVVFVGSYSGPICQWVSSNGVPDTVAGPGQIGTFNVTWNQLDANGEQAVPPGTYEAMAFFVCLYPPPANGPTGSYDTADCQGASVIPPLNEFISSPFRSSLMQFTIQ